MCFEALLASQKVEAFSMDYTWKQRNKQTRILILWPEMQQVARPQQWTACRDAYRLEADDYYKVIARRPLINDSTDQDQQ